LNDSAGVLVMGEIGNSKSAEHRQALAHARA